MIRSENLTDPAARAGAMAARMRARILRYAATQQVHLGSSLSATDILAVAYNWLSGAASTRADRDRLLLSKGHAVWAQYAALAELDVPGLDPTGSGLMPGHPTETTPGVEAPTGALGHGLSIAAGMAEGTRRQGFASRIVVVLGDGELGEGSVWEAAMFIAHRRLGQVTAIVDRNGLQQEGATAEILGTEPLADKWRAFGWHVETVDGHDPADLVRGLDAAVRHQKHPTVLLATTTKGHGVSFMENSLEWHVGCLDDEQLRTALRQVGAPAC